MLDLLGRVSGGAGGNRTPDLDIANVALSQLSYGPGDANSALPVGERKARAITPTASLDNPISVGVRLVLLFLLLLGMCYGADGT